MKSETDERQKIELKVSAEDTTQLTEAPVERLEECSTSTSTTADSISNESSAAPKVTPVSTVHASHAKLLEKAMQAVPKNRPSIMGQRLCAHFVDCSIVSLLGGLFTAMLVYLLCSLLGPVLPFGFVSMHEFLIWFLTYFGLSFVPVFKSFFLVTANMAAEMRGYPSLGQIVVSDTLLPLGTTAWFEPAVASTLTWFVLVGPLVALPLYKAFMQSSPRRATIGESVFKLQVTDSDDRPLRLFNATVRNFLWFLTPLFGMLPLLSARAAEVLRPAHYESTEFASREDSQAVILHYRSFEGVERWLRDRFAGNRITRFFSQSPAHKIAGMFLAMIVMMMVPLLIQAGGILGSKALIALASLFISPEAAQKIAAGYHTNDNFVFATFLELFLGALFGAVFLTYISKPSGIALSGDGIRWLWPTRQRLRTIPWSELDEIKLVHEESKGSTKKDRVMLSLSGKTKMSLRMNCLDSIRDRELLMSAIESWAPHVRRNAELVQTLQPPADLSYTDVWLTALTAPPKRERLKPLAQGMELHEGAYKVLRSVGTGGQGFAYLAEQKGNADRVVLKEFILPVFVDVAVRRKALEKFEHEARLLKRLDNHQVVKLVDYFVEDHRAYLVLEYIDGQSLRQLVEEKGNLPSEQVVELSKQMGQILQYLHNESPPIIHRDFTPDNLILHKDGTLKLIDFNVAQQMDATVVATVVGKHAYLAPEQFQGRPVAASDIYSMGATMHYLLTGKDPLPISTSHPQKSISEISSVLDTIVAKATTRLLNERYEKVEDLLADLASAK